MLVSMLRELPADAPDWVADHVHAMQAVAHGIASPAELVHVPWPEGSEHWDEAMGTPAGQRTIWYRLPYVGAVENKRHQRAASDADGWTIDSTLYITPLPPGDGRSRYLA